ncbi:MAG TPA: MFS transporter [Gemmatimonadales bacterium]|nr:MFS transporter [Gemmatimonadales bacterium]
MASQSWLKVWGQRKMVALALLGFASGLPLYLTGRTLQAWMRVAHVDLTTIGFFSLVGLPYSLKWLWAPAMDRYVPPFLGRRRGWLLITQGALLIAIAAMSLHDPSTGLRLIALNAIVIAFFSASQDIVIDAYRTDILTTREMGAGAAIWVLGYRVALLTTGALAFVLADRMPWPSVYLVLSTLVLIGVASTLFAPEPVLREPPPQTFTEAVVLPFREFFSRAGPRRGFLVLLFIVVYKLPDYLAASLATPFLLDIGFSQTEIGAVQGGLGIAVTIVGALAGGALIARLDINRSLWLVGLLQAASNLGYYVLALAGKDHAYLVGAIVVENFCTGLVASGFVAFLMSLCNARFSATQFALLSSLMGVSRDVLVSPSGAIAEATGWPLFFLLSLVAAVPGLLLLPVFAPWNRPSPMAAPHEGTAA